MRITCPYCGERGSDEFSYHGPADLARPDPSAFDAKARFHDYVYLRDNPAGAHRELWFHARGCRAWLVIERNTLTHTIASVTFADPSRQEIE